MGSNQKDDNQHKHELEQLLEAIVVNCQHVAAISKGLCVKGVSHDVSLAELAKHKDLKDSDSAKILKDEYMRSKEVLSDCVISLSKLKEKYLAEYNKNNAEIAPMPSDVGTTTLENETPSVNDTNVDAGSVDPSQVDATSSADTVLPTPKGKAKALSKKQ